MEGGKAVQQTNTVVSIAMPAPSGKRSTASAQSAEYAVLLFDLHGQIQFASPNAALLLHSSVDILHSESIASLIPSLPFGINDIQNQFVYPTARSATTNWQAIRVNSQALEARLTPTEIAGQQFVVLELRTAETDPANLQLQNFLHAHLEAQEMLVVTDTTGKIVYVNPAFEAASGFSFEEAIGHTLEDIIAWEKYPPLYTQMWSELGAGNSFHGIFINRKKDQHLFHEERFARPFVNPDGRVTHYIFTGRDVSEREKLIQRLEHLASHDVLTDLPNRHLFLDRLHQAQVHAARWSSGFTLLLLDLDNFKNINDQFGHAAGDAVLIAVANRLTACVREEDTIARLGGDEFAVILADTDPHNGVTQVLDKLVLELRKPIQFNNRELPAHASIGVAFYPLDSLHPDILFNYADSAMYHAKALGGDSYHYHHMHTHTTHDDASHHSNITFGRQLLAHFTMNKSEGNDPMKEDQ